MNKNEFFGSPQLVIRLRAFLYHLLLSVIIAGSALLFAKLIWYPNDLLHATGAIKVFVLIMLVDVCFGPLLTLVAYNPAKDKKELKRDMSVIVIFQFAALIYGFLTLFGGRPVYYVFAVDRFELVQASSIPEVFLEDSASSSYASLPKLGQEWVYAELPKDINERNDVLFTQIENGVDLAQTPMFYAPLQVGQDNIREKIRPLADLDQSNSPEQLEKAGLPELSKNNELGYLPLAAKKKDLVIIVHRDTLEVSKIVDLIPWREGE